MKLFCQSVPQASISEQIKLFHSISILPLHIATAVASGSEQGRRGLFVLKIFVISLYVL